MAITGGYSIGGGSATGKTYTDIMASNGGYGSFFETKTDSYQENKDIENVKANNEVISKTTENQKENNYVDQIFGLGTAYYNYQASKNMGTQGELDKNNSPTAHKTVDSKAYLEGQKARYGDYQNYIEDLQSRPQSELTDYQKYAISNNESSIIPNLTGNKTLDIVLIIVILMFGYKMIQKL